MATHTLSFKQALSHPNRPLANLYAQIEQQKKLLAAIRTNLPKQLADHALHCVITDKKLLLYTDSAAWATQLRFYNRAILKSIDPFIRHRIEILQIRISEPIDSQQEKKKRIAKIPAPDKIAAIRSNAMDDADDPLSRALLKLRSTLERLSEQSADSQK